MIRLISDSRPIFLNNYVYIYILDQNEIPNMKHKYNANQYNNIHDSNHWSAKSSPQAKIELTSNSIYPEVNLSQLNCNDPLDFNVIDFNCTTDSAWFSPQKIQMLYPDQRPTYRQLPVQVFFHYFYCTIDTIYYKF